ncbi:MAG: GntR family transcriptional regulator [Rhodospirillales bacterium]|jgi:GntR family transcriptional regulator, rspAB operon transcriptional repressor|nr:GntR family transcriptional regulator [Rhodospirillales bacterium]
MQETVKPSLKEKGSLPFGSRMVKSGLPIRSQVYELLYGGIRKVDIPPGRVISEPEVSEALGVSRGPVREAFIRLAGEGLVEVIPQVGTFVTRLDVSVLMEAIYVRQALEPDLAARAAAHPTSADPNRLKELSEMQDMAAQAIDLDRVWDLDNEFHHTVAMLSGLPGVWKYVSSVRVTLARLRTLELLELDNPRIWVSHHRRIADCICRNDPEGARKLMCEHIDVSIGQIEELRARFPSFFTAGDLGDSFVL